MEDKSHHAVIIIILLYFTIKPSRKSQKALVSVAEVHGTLQTTAYRISLDFCPSTTAQMLKVSFAEINGDNLEFTRKLIHNRYYRSTMHRHLPCFNVKIKYNLLACEIKYNVFVRCYICLNQTTIIAW